MKKNMSAKMIKKAIDSYPGGICFSALDGRVILVNEKMNKLALELTGHTILNAKAAWDELAHFANNGKAEKLDQSSTKSAKNCTRTPSDCARCKSGRKPCWTALWKSI